MISQWHSRVNVSATAISINETPRHAFVLGSLNSALSFPVVSWTIDIGWGESIGIKPGGGEGGGKIRVKREQHVF